MSTYLRKKGKRKRSRCNIGSLSSTPGRACYLRGSSAGRVQRTASRWAAANSTTITRLDIFPRRSKRAHPFASRPSLRCCSSRQSHIGPRLVYSYRIYSWTICFEYVFATFFFACSSSRIFSSVLKLFAHVFAQRKDSEMCYDEHISRGTRLGMGNEAQGPTLEWCPSTDCH